MKNGRLTITPDPFSFKYAALGPNVPACHCQSRKLCIPFFSLPLARSLSRPLPFILILSLGAQRDSAWMSLGINGLPLSWKLEQENNYSRSSIQRQDLLCAHRTCLSPPQSTQPALTFETFWSRPTGFLSHLQVRIHLSDAERKKITPSLSFPLCASVLFMSSARIPPPPPTAGLKPGTIDI